MSHRNPPHRSRLTVAACLFVGALVPLGAGVGCQNDKQTGALLGAGVGALIGQAAGGDTGATLLGAGIGAGVGYVAGDVVEDQKAEKAKQREAESAASYPAAETYPRAEAAPAETYPRADTRSTSLANTSWRLTSLTMEPRLDYQQVIVTFAGDSTVTTLITHRDGSVKSARETYRVVDGSLFITDHNGETIEASYDRFQDQLIVVAPNFKAVMQEIK